MKNFIAAKGLLALKQKEATMTLPVLQMLVKETLPYTLTGPNVEAIQVLVTGGWVKATIVTDPTHPERSQATVHAITALGRMQLSMFR